MSSISGSLMTLIFLSIFWLPKATSMPSVLDKDLTVDNIRNSIEKNLNELKSMTREEIFSHRKNKFLSIGRGKGFASKIELEDSLVMKENIIQKILISFNNSRYLIILIFFLIILGLGFYLL